MANEAESKLVVFLRSRLFCLATLTAVFIAVYYAAYWLRFEGNFSPFVWQTMLLSIGWVVAIKIAVFGWFRVYQGWNRYITFSDLIILCKAASVSSLLLVAGDYLFSPGAAISRSVILMDWGATLVIVGGLRSAVRIGHEKNGLFLFSSKQKPIFIIGANDAGERLLRTIQCNTKIPHACIGFIDNNPQKLRTRIGGIPVLGPVSQVCKLAQRHGVEEVLLIAGELPGRVVRQLVEDCQNQAVQVQVLPSYEQLLQGNIKTQLRPVNIEDLLRRETVSLDLKNIHDWMSGRTILVTGSAGSIGSELSRQLLKLSPRKVILLDRTENGQFFLERELIQKGYQGQFHICLADVTDEHRMSEVLQRHRPDIIFHAAAYKHVPLMESNPGEAIKNIALATRQLAVLADRYQVDSFVLISSDKAVNPTNVMGASKRIAELFVQSISERSSCHFVTVRFGNVLDSAGSVVPIFREQIKRGGPITVTDERMERYFMTIPEASQLVIQAGAMGKGGEIFVLDMGEPVRIIDLAQDMIRLSGLKVGEDIEIEFTGLRPGEKLHEELHIAGEKHIPTRHPKITVAEKVDHDSQEIQTAMKRLELVRDMPAEVVYAELERILPEFHRQSMSDKPEEKRRAA